MTRPTVWSQIEAPVGLGVSPAGVLVVCDRDGERVRCTGPDGDHEWAPPARVARMAVGEEGVALACTDGRMRACAFDGTVRGEEEFAVGALALAFAPSGSLVVLWPGDVERTGALPVRFVPREVTAPTCLATDSGGVWVAGTNAARYRPVRDGYEWRRTVTLPAPVCAMSLAPDGSLCLALGDGTRIWRIAGETAAELCVLPTPAVALARAPGALLACGPGGLADLTAHLPPLDGDGPQFTLPACSS